MDKSEHLKVEQKIIHLMLKSPQVLSELLDDGYGIDFFDTVHHSIVDAIFQEYISSNYKRLLTREAYKYFLLENKASGDLVLNLKVYDECFIKAYAVSDELGYLKKQFIENFISRKIFYYLEDFKKDSKSIGYLLAAKNLSDKLNSSINLTETKKQSVLCSLDEFKDDFVAYIKNRKEHPETIVRCGIPEIDESICVGLRPMHFTLFVADVGGGKTALMMNIALNIYDKGHSVLFIPLEMDRYDLVSRIISNRTGIDSSLLNMPEFLSNEQMKKIEDCQIWLGKQHKFQILDAPERTSVSSLKKEIEVRVGLFKPKVVIIDYIANLKPDMRYTSRNDLEIGEILKSLRFLGKQHNFHIISAAQMGRAAIKALREGKDDVVDSTSIHGSHQYGADSDNIFGLVPVQGEPDKIKLISIKSRHGPKGGVSELRFERKYCRITSTKSTMNLTSDTDLESDLATPPSEISHTLETTPSIDFDGLKVEDEISELGL